METQQLKLDLVIFGASGFTGVQLIRYMGGILKTESCEGLSWGVSGRSQKKLQGVLAEIAKETGEKELLNVPVIIADVFDTLSLQNLASQTRVLINCTGPYQLYGEPVVKACIQQACHYVDVCAESQFCEKMQLNYTATSQAKGVYVVTACGFDSIPVDIGVDFLRKNFDGTLNSVETYHEIYPEGGFGTGPSLNEGTWQSLVLYLENRSDLQKIRRKLFEKEMPPLKPKLGLRTLPHQCRTMFKGWVAPYPGTDAHVVQRSQRCIYEETNARPIQIQTYLVAPYFLQVPLLGIGALTWLGLAKFKCGASLLKNHPKFFTFGLMAPKPSKEEMDKVAATIWLRGRGWKDQVVDASYDKPTDSEIIGRVKTRNGYKFTAIASICCALALLFEMENLPKNGGIFTPATAFTKTSLTERLLRNGVEFEICSGGPETKENFDRRDV